MSRENPSVLPRIRLVDIPIRVWAGVFVFGLAAAVLLASDIFPIVTDDSLAYLAHSDSIGTTGFVQFGYRQVGYPLFLTSVDTLATAIRMEPLLLTAIIQRIVYLGALAAAAWLWRWRSLPLIVLGILPTAMVYPNFILTEGIGVGLALWYAVLVTWMINRSRRNRNPMSRGDETKMIVAGVAVALIFMSLAMIRFQYVLTVFGVLAVLLIMYGAGRRTRVTAISLVVGLFVVGSTFFFFVSQENSDEIGSFFPSVRGERSQFWAAWHVTFTLSPENQDNPQLEELFGGGTPYKTMGEIDALPLYSEQQAAYSVALEDLVTGSGSSLLTERTKAFLGVLRGGRIDDVEKMVHNASETSFATVEQSIFRASTARREGVPYLLERFNEGRTIQPVLTSALAPIRTFPYFTTFLSWLVPLSLLALIAGFARRDARLMAGTGLVTLGVTAVVFGYLLMDNVRFILVPLLFVMATATAVVDQLWQQRRGRAPRGAQSSR